MANETEISKLIAAGAVEELEKADKALQSLQKTYIEIGKELAKSLSINVDNLPTLTKQTEDYRKLMDKLTQAVDKFNNIADKFKSTIDAVSEVQNATSASSKKYNETLHESNKVIQKSTETIKQNTQTTKENIQTKLEDVTISKEVKNLVDQTLGSRSENIRRLSEETSALRELSRQKKIIDKLEKEGSLSASDATKSREELTRKELVHQQTRRELLRILTNETKGITSINDSYQEQSLQLERLTKAYLRLDSAQRNSPGGKNLLLNIQALDKNLKAIDASMGKYGRSVGNYKSHWDGLGNSINQLTREFPAFAISLQTGILALSNNIPILADEIARIRKENAMLKAEGLQTVPTWKRITSSLLSWQTVLSLGITLVTIYGKEIAAWAKKMLDAEDATKTLQKAQKDLNSSNGEFVKQVKNTSSSYGENVITLRKLQTEWNKLGDSLDKKKQFIIDNASEFGKLDVSINDVNDAENLLVGNTKAFISAMKARAMAEAARKLAADKYAESLQKEVEAEKRRKEITFWDKFDWNSLAGASSAGQQLSILNTKIREFSVTTEEAKGRANAAADDIEEEGKALEAVGKMYLDVFKKYKEEEANILKSADIDIFSDEEKRKALAEKLKRERERLAKEQLDSQRKLEDSRLAVLDESIEKERKKLEVSFKRRIEDVKTKGINVIELTKAIEAERDKALSDFDENSLRQRLTKEAELRVEYAEKGSFEELDARLDVLVLQKEAELKEAEKLGMDKEEINIKYLKKIEDAYLDYGKRRIEIAQSQNEMELYQDQESMNRELADLEVLYSKGKKKKEQYEKEKADIQYKYAVKALQSELDILENSLNILSGDERLNAEKKIAQLRVQLSKSTSDKIIADAQRELNERKNIEEAKKQLIKDAYDAIFSIGDSMFERSINNIEEEIEANEEATDERIAQIERLAETGVITAEEAEARKRAAESMTAQKNKELEKQKADLQTRQARFQKAQAITQAIISTAVAVTQSLPNFILAALVAAMGAIQLATIIAQPIPKYAKGTPEEGHPGGLAIVGDGGKAEAIVIGDKIYRTPSVPTLVDLPKGADVLPDVQQADFLAVVQRETGYFLTHNQHGEPVSIVNNFDTSGIEYRLDKLMKVQKEVIEAISDGRRRDNYEAYKNWR